MRWRSCSAVSDNPPEAPRLGGSAAFLVGPAKAKAVLAINTNTELSFAIRELDSHL
jgi:hypothetical protein